MSIVLESYLIEMQYCDWKMDPGQVITKCSSLSLCNLHNTNSSANKQNKMVCWELKRL